MKEEGMKREERGNFPEKNFRRHGIGGQRFFRKNFFGIRKYEILCDLSCASRRLGLGGAPLPTCKNGKFAANKAIQAHEIGQTVQMYTPKIWNA